MNGCKQNAGGNASAQSAQGGGVQTEMDLGKRPRIPSAERVQELCRALGDGGWHKRRELETLGFGERELRVIAQHNRRIILTGNRGYRLLSAATLEEIRRGRARLAAQAAEMLAAVVILENEAHRRIHRAATTFSQG